MRARAARSPCRPPSRSPGADRAERPREGRGLMAARSRDENDCALPSHHPVSCSTSSQVKSGLNHNFRTVTASRKESHSILDLSVHDTTRIHNQSCHVMAHARRPATAALTYVLSSHSPATSTSSPPASQLVCALTAVRSASATACHPSRPFQPSSSLLLSLLRWRASS